MPAAEKVKCVTLSTLKSRGWTESMVRDLLGDPDVQSPNPHYRSGPPMRLYSIARVESVEETPAWADRRDKAAAHSESRRASASKAAATKRAKLLAWVNKLRIDVPRIDDDKLTELACNHYNDLWADRGKSHKYADPSDDPEFLDRITVNYLRHVGSKYESLLCEMFGKVGVAEGYARLRGRILSAIAASYPALRRECERQSEELKTESEA